jgi:hypothetical protein
LQVAWDSALAAAAVIEELEDTLALCNLLLARELVQWH